jgi:hypothetical protein
MSNLKCPQCGNPLEDGVTVCGSCSKELKEDEIALPRQNPEKMPGSKKLYAILAVLLVLLGGGAMLIFSGLLPNPLQDRSTVAIVNGEKIFASEVNRELETYKRNYGKASGMDFSSTEGKKALDNIRKKIIQIMIQERILLAAAAEEKITVTPQEVTDKINAIKTGLKLSDAGFEEFLKKNDMNMAGYKQHIERDALIKKVFERGVQKGMERDALIIELRARAKIEVVSE